MTVPNNSNTAAPTTTIDFATGSVAQQIYESGSFRMEFDASGWSIVNGGLTTSSTGGTYKLTLKSIDGTPFGVESFKFAVKVANSSQTYATTVTGVDTLTGAVVQVVGPGKGTAPQRNFIPAEAEGKVFNEITLTFKGLAGTVLTLDDIVLTPIDPTPVLTIAPTHLSITEGDAPLAIDAGLTLADGDSSTLAKAEVTLKSGSQVSDVSAKESLSLLANSSTMGNIVADYDVATGVLTLTSANASATLAQWQAALRAVVYQNESDAPVAERTVNFKVFDANDHSAEISRTIDITGVNDAPKISVPATPQPAQVGHSISLADLAIVDPDSDALTVTLIARGGVIDNLQDEDINVDGIQVTGTVQQINTKLDSATFTAAGSQSYIDISVSDGQGNPVTGTYDFAAPLVLTLTSGPLSFIENGADLTVDAGLTLTSANAVLLHSASVYLQPMQFGRGASFEGPDSLVFKNDNATMGDITASFADGELSMHSDAGASVAQWQAALRAVAYHNPSDDPTWGRTVRFVVYDNEDGQTEPKARAINITPVNDAPVFTDIPVTTQTVAVGVAAELADVKVVDPDSDFLMLTLTATNGEIGKLVDIDSSTAGIQLAGTAEAINLQLKDATFTAKASGAATITLSITDSVHNTFAPSLIETLPTVATYHLNAPAAPVTPTTPNAPVDGVPVQVVNAPDGTHVITVPVVTPGRTDDPTSPSSQLADIPLITQGGVSLLTVGAPVGASFTASGPAALVSVNDALNALMKQIAAIAAIGQVRTDFGVAGKGFLDGLASAQQLIVQTITPVASTGQALVVTGTPQSGTSTALVIDTSSLSGTTNVKLDNIDFALIVGAANVTGGAGANLVYGDDDRQFIVLGEDDDVIHGGGDNDTVGSLRGKDQIFGDAGDDVVYGGTNDDVLTGGTGNDQLNGGFGLDTAVQSGTLADYTVSLDGATVVLTHKTSGEIDRLLDVEIVTFASGQGLVIAHEASDVAALTAAHPTAQLIELNLNRAVAGTSADDTVTPELGIALNIDLGDGQDVVKIAGTRADVNLAVEAGNRVELTRLVDGAMLAFNNVEALAFDGGEVTVLAHNHNQAAIGRAYELVLNRNVDTEGYGFWVKATQAGSSLQSVLSSILESSEFTGAHAGLSNSDFTDLLYQNGLNRAADAAGKAFWVGALDAGVSRAQVVESIAASTEAVSVIGSTIDVTVVS